MDPIIIYGAGGFAREVAWLIEDANSAGLLQARVVSFVDDDPSREGSVVNEIEVNTFESACRKFPEARFALGVGSPRARATLSERVRNAGFRFQSVRHPDVRMSRFNTIGDACVICAGVIITTNVTIGRNVHVNLDCTIGHDAVLEDDVTLAPGVHVSGRVRIGRGAYIGTGAVIINGSETKFLNIGEHAVVGAGASVIRDVPAGATVVGVPAAPLSRKFP